MATRSHITSMRLALLTLALLNAASASAQVDLPTDPRWVLVAERSTQKVYVDTQTLTWQGPVAEAWGWWAMTTPSPADEGVPEWDRATRRVLVDCERRTMQLTYVVNYRRGMSVERADMTGSSAPHPWIPDTTGEEIGESVCALRPR